MACERGAEQRAAHRRLRLATPAAAALLVVALAAAATDVAFRPHRIALDLNAFYCAGLVVAAGADPYRAEPLGTCERRPMPRPFPAIRAGVTMPAPIPPYALAPFVLLARLPFAVVVALWSALVLAAAAATVALLFRLTGLAPPGLIAAFGLGTVVALELGQVAPFAVVALAGAALLARSRPAAAALAAAAAMLEPHVGLPACFALFLWVPRSRPALVACALALAALSLALVGPAILREYLFDVLPLHALAEVANPQQMSLTYVLHRLGAGDPAALGAGELWYALMVVGGVAAAGRFRRSAPELVPTLPVAFAVLGGAFIHAVQVPAALPAALIVLARTGGATRHTLALGTLGIALPFVQFYGLGPGAIPLYAAVAVLIVVALGRLPLAAGAFAGMAAAAVPLALWMTLPAMHEPPAAALVTAYNPSALAPTVWRTFFDLSQSGAAWLALDVVKVPMWAGLAAVCVAGCTARTAEPRPRTAPASAP